MDDVFSAYRKEDLNSGFSEKGREQSFINSIATKLNTALSKVPVDVCGAVPYVANPRYKQGVEAGADYDLSNWGMTTRPTETVKFDIMGTKKKKHIFREATQEVCKTGAITVARRCERSVDNLFIDREVFVFSWKAGKLKGDGVTKLDTEELSRGMVSSMAEKYNKRYGAKGLQR